MEEFFDIVSGNTLPHSLKHLQCAFEHVAIAVVISDHNDPLCGQKFIADPAVPGSRCFRDINKIIDHAMHTLDIPLDALLGDDSLRNAQLCQHQFNCERAPCKSLGFRAGQLIADHDPGLCRRVVKNQRSRIF